MLNFGLNLALAGMLTTSALGKCGPCILQSRNHSCRGPCFPAQNYGRVKGLTSDMTFRTSDNIFSKLGYPRQVRPLVEFLNKAFDWERWCKIGKPGGHCKGN